MTTHRLPSEPRQKCKHWSGVGCVVRHDYAMPFEVRDPDMDGEFMDIMAPCPCHDGGGCIQEGYLGISDEELPEMPLLSVFVDLHGRVFAFPDIDRSGERAAPDECVVFRAVKSGVARVGFVRRTPCESIGDRSYRERVAAEFPGMARAKSPEDRPYQCHWWQVEMV